MTWGDDYEILFTAGAVFSPPEGVARIGRIVAGPPPPLFRDADAKPVSFRKLSFQHF